MEDNVVIPLETGVITFNMVILIAADDSHYSPDLIRRTFHVTMVCSHHAYIVPESNIIRLVQFVLPLQQRKTPLKPLPSSSTSHLAKTHQVFTSQVPQSRAPCGNLEDFANLESLNRHRTIFAKRKQQLTIGWTCCLSITPMIKIFSNLKAFQRSI